MDIIQILNVLLLAFPPVLFWGYFYYIKDSKEPEPLRLMVKAFVFGMIVAGGLVAIAYIFENYDRPVVSNVTSLFVVLAFVEEFVKLAVLMKLTSARAINVNQIIDGVIYAVCIALGFAFVENIYYFAQYIAFAEKGAELYGTYLARGFGTMLAHTIFSGIAGYYYILGKVEKKALWVNGLGIAVVLHSLFNYFSSGMGGDFNLAYLNVVLLGGSLWFLLWLIKNKNAKKIQNIK